MFSDLLLVTPSALASQEGQPFSADDALSLAETPLVRGPSRALASHSNFVHPKTKEHTSLVTGLEHKVF